MPREKRKKSKTGIYHVMLRGINQQTIFEDKEDKKRFLETLAKFKEVGQYVVYGYCLMDNHIHLLIKETEEPLSLSIQRIISSYVHWYNSKYSRCGHLFQERFKSEVVEDSKYFLVVLRYIHQNPLKAGLAKTILDCKWTSLKEYLYRPKLVEIELALTRFSLDPKEARNMFLTFMSQDNEDECLDYYNKPTDEEVREYMRELGIVNSSSFQRMQRANRNEILRQLKKIEGVSLGQLSRITGISKSLIHRVVSR
ncbi:transposase [Sutcliffiella cohnii]|uniref:transposase n=1 Tax=Sutcliffiella cohnii TaxID=33932 RepID=UPI002E21B6D1|nr:transposase [Sutcliffiella cohnii]MED4014668.1 transposase [Sutcliffiella cohnii]